MIQVNVYFLVMFIFMCFLYIYVYIFDIESLTKQMRVK